MDYDELVKATAFRGVRVDYDQLRKCADDLAEQLRDCIEELEGKSYIKPYVKIVYVGTLERYAALIAQESHES